MHGVSWSLRITAKKSEQINSQMEQNHSEIDSVSLFFPQDIYNMKNSLTYGFQV